MTTVIIPAYNRSNDLRQALYSLCAQTKSDFKVLISDDGSTEDLVSVCDEFKSKLDITYIKSKKNRGCGGNRAFALDYFLTEINTTYFTFLDSDDALLPQAVERLEAIIEHNGADIIVTDIWQEYNGDIKNIIPAKDSRTWMHGKIYRSEFIKKNNLTFPTHLKTNEDLAFNLSLYAYDPESYLMNEEVYYFRRNPNSTTKNPTTLALCNSVDYIEAIYWAFCHYKAQNHPLDRLMISNVINLYNYYQTGLILDTLTEQSKQHIRKMVREHQVAIEIISIYNHPDMQFPFKQWVVKGKTLVFFGQTFGSWLSMYFKPEEIDALIKEVQNQK